MRDMMSNPYLAVLLKQSDTLESALGLTKEAANPVSVAKSMWSTLRNNIYEPRHVPEMYTIGALSLAGAPITHVAGVLKGHGGYKNWFHRAMEGEANFKNLDMNEYSKVWAPAAFTVGTTAAAACC